MNELIYIGEMLRLSGDASQSDAAALKIAQAKNGGADAKLLTYSSCHALAGPYRGAARRALAGLKWALFGALSLAVLFGAMAGFTAFQQTPSGGQVNVFWLLASLLGVHFLSLVLWAVFVWRTPHASLSIFSVLNKVIAWAARKQPQQVLAVRSVAGVQLDGALGRASISALSHGFWFLYLLAGFIAAVVLLSVQSYQFMWETTLLLPETAVAIFTMFGKPLALLGFDVPSASIITAAENFGSPSQTKEDAALWARFCLSALVVYGIVPRFLLSAISIVWRRRVIAGIQLKASDPFYASLLAQIYQPTAVVEVIDPDRTAPPEKHINSAPLEAKRNAVPAGKVIGWEVDGLDGAVFDPADIVGMFEEVSALETAIGSLGGAPATLAVSLLNTPDRGVENALRALSALPADKRGAVLLNISELKARSNPDDVKRRIGDWWSLLIRLGFEQSSITIDGAQNA